MLDELNLAVKFFDLLFVISAFEPIARLELSMTSSSNPIDINSLFSSDEVALSKP